MKNTSKKQLSVYPLDNRVIISKPPEKTNPNHEQRVDGIIIPATAQHGGIIEPYYVAEVLAVGPECKRVKVGQKVIISRPDIFHVEAGGTESYMVREPNCVGIVS